MFNIHGKKDLRSHSCRYIVLEFVVKIEETLDVPPAPKDTDQYKKG